MTRDELIFVLEMRTKFSYEYLKRLDKEQLEKLYKDRVLNGKKE